MDINTYKKSGLFSKKQLHEIELGIMYGIQDDLIASYADASLSSKKMRKMRQSFTQHKLVHDMDRER